MIFNFVGEVIIMVVVVVVVVVVVGCCWSLLLVVGKQTYKNIRLLLVIGGVFCSVDLYSFWLLQELERNSELF